MQKKKEKMSLHWLGWLLGSDGCGFCQGCWYPGPDQFCAGPPIGYWGPPPPIGYWPCGPPFGPPGPGCKKQKQMWLMFMYN